MAKAWRNEAARKINKQRDWELFLSGKVTTPTARHQKNERLFLEKVFKVKAAGNWLMAGLLNGLYTRWGILATAPSYKPKTKDGRYAASYGASDRKVKQTDLRTLSAVVAEKPGIIKSFLAKAKKFFS